MDDRHDLERALRDLYDDAPALPGHVLSKALQESAGTRQRRWAWLPARRLPSLQSRSRGSSLFVPLAAVIVVAVLAVGLVGLLLGQSDPSSQTPGATATSVPSIAPSPASRGRVIVVDPDGAGDVTTLEAALAMADDGDTIALRPGTHVGGATVDRSVHIRGDGPRETVVVIATGETPTVELDDTLAYAFLTQGSDAVISGLTLRNAGAQAFAPVVAVGGAPTLADLDAGGTIWLTDGSSAIVRDSSLEGLAMTGELGDPVTEGNVMAPARSTVEQGLAARVPAHTCEPWREEDEPFMFGATGAIRCPGPADGVTQLALFAFPDIATLERYWRWRIDDLDLPAEGDDQACSGGAEGVQAWSDGATACYRSEEAEEVAKIRWTVESELVYGVLDGIDRDVAALHHHWQELVDE